MLLPILAPAPAEAKGVFKYYVSAFRGGVDGGGLSQNADTADALEEGGGSKPK